MFLQCIYNFDTKLVAGKTSNRSGFRTYEVGHNMVILLSCLLVGVMMDRPVLRSVGQSRTRFPSSLLSLSLSLAQWSFSFPVKALPYTRRFSREIKWKSSDGARYSNAKIVPNTIVSDPHLLINLVVDRYGNCIASTNPGIFARACFIFHLYKLEGY